MDKVYKGTKERIWQYVKKRYLISDRAKKWVLQTVGADWRGFKGRLKRDHYKPYKTNKMRWNKRPDYVPSEHFRWLLKRWNDSKDQERARKNAENRAKQTDMHTCGKKSFAMIRENLIQADEEKKEPSNAEMFKATRKRVPGRTYKEASEDTQNKIRLHPQMDLDAEALKRLGMATQSPGDASSAQNHHQRKFGVSSVGTNE
ncbi:hypothetical protein Dimus_035920, partial [Dionaea muscipula]